MRYKLFGLFVLMLLLVTACRQKEVAKPVENVTSTQTVVAANTISRTFTIPVVLSKQFFYPANMSLNKGDQVTLQIQSIDQDHTVFLTSNNTAFEIPMGQTVDVAFVVNQPTITILCTDKCDPDVKLVIKQQ
jgi:hypothetical protein